ncbi:NAD(P)H-dependent flavin oxidoreductase [Agromyces bauzanensis]
MRDLVEVLGIERPIVLGPFGGLSSIELTAAVSERGGLGSYGLYGYDADRIRETVTALRAATDRPFALNLWLPHDEVEQVSDDDFSRYAQALQPFFDELGLELPERPERYLPTFEAQFDAVIEARPAVVSFVFGVPSAAVVEAAHERGIAVVGTATNVDEAVVLERGGVDAIVATGPEAGGHRVSFLRPAEESLVGVFALVPQVADAVNVPVIAAGGIADRRGVAAAFALGASGVQVGTAFLRTEQSATTDAHRMAITQAPAHGTVLTRAMSGRWARGIPNRAVRAIEHGGVVAPFPVQNWLTGRFRAEAVRRGIGELQSLWAGQAAALAREADAHAVFAELAAGLPA